VKRVTLNPTATGALERYLDLLLSANQRMNLTRITDRDQARIQHIADALTLLPHLPSGPHRLADVGSGGGVPGIPLAIARPDIAVTLIESVAKKAAFLEETVSELELGNAVVWRGRAEEWHGKRFDVVAVRAVAPMARLLDWCRPLVAPGGKLLAMKGPKLAEELEAARGVLNRQGAEISVHPVTAEGLSGHVVAEVTWGRPPA
jgi:16S rRNA (guanine527-N7)-methyltransferase